MSKKTKSTTGRASSRKDRGAIVKPTETEALVVSSVEPPVVSTAEPRTHRELAQAIFAECGAVQVGCELLQSGAERGAAVRARMFETLANWQFGKAAAPAGHSAVRVIWDVPRPPHESEEPQ